MGKGTGKNRNFIPGQSSKQGSKNSNNIKNQSARNQTSRTILSNPSHIGGRGGK